MSLSFGSQNKSTTSNQTTNTNSNPWAPTIPALTGLVGAASALPTGVTPGQTAAFDTLRTNAAAGDPGAAAIAANATSQLGAGNQTGVVNDALATEQKQLTPYANGSMTDISNNPQIQGLLKTIADDTSNRVNQQFAGAGRDMSGMNQQTLARGLAQGEAPVLLNEFNQQQQNQLNASQALGGAANAATSTNAGLTAAQTAIQGAGVATDQAALAAKNYGPTQSINVDEAKTALPFQNLGMLASLMYPAAQLGGTSTSNTTGKSTTSGTSFGGNMNILSDERAKENIHEVGAMADGTPIHRYNYKGDATTRIGPMAQEVEQRTPGAVENDGPGGLKTVNMDIATRKAAAIVKGRLAAKRKAA